MLCLKKEIFRKIIYFTAVLFVCTFQASCQRQLSPQAINAIDLFENKNFPQAYIKFKSLQEKFPKDPLYQYYTGACLIELGQNIEEAGFYLKAAAVKNAHPNIPYYLGRAYYYQFNFSEALNSYKEMQKAGRKPETKNLPLQHEIKKTTYASDFFSLASDFDFLNRNKINPDSLGKSLSGYFEISQKWDLPVDANLYALKNQKNNLIFFSMPVKNGAQRDLFFVKVDENGRLSEPKSPGNIINTNEDEDFAVFSESENRLYFASKGHRSVGGYDIYFSSMVNGQWTAPEHLPFPINTPWDDFLFIPQNHEQLFISNRNNAREYFIFCISPFEKAERITLSDRESMLEMMYKKPKNKTTKIADSKTENTGQNVAEQVRIVISEDERQKLIGEALTIQKTADSLLLLARQIRTELHSTEEAKERSRLFANMSRLEKKSVLFQEKATEIYLKILNSTSLKDSAKVALIEKTGSIFEISKKSPYNKANPIPFDQVLPAGIIYRIQLGAFSKNADTERFGSMSPVSAEALQDGKIVKYYVGIFSAYDDAEKALRKVKESGFKEAFIVSYIDNKKIPVERAKELEK